MLIWGHRGRSLDLGPAASRHCSTCGQERAFRTRVDYQYNHFWYVFGFVSGKSYSERCAICGQGTVLETARTEERLGRNAVPMWDRFGLLAAFGAGVGLILLAVLLRLSGPEIRNIPDLTERMMRGDATALAQLRREAEAGDLPSQMALGDLLGVHGPETFRDLEEAFRWTLAAATQGNALAQRSVATRYENGIGTKVDTAAALRWYRAAAEQGSAAAANSIGAFYLQGIEVAADPIEALQWFRKAADAGDAPGEFNLAMGYLSGNGIEQDLAQAVRWLEKAAAAEGRDSTSVLTAAEAMNQLGKLYEEGSGVEKDVLKALNYYQSASPSNVEARESVERLRARLSTEPGR